MNSWKLNESVPAYLIEKIKKTKNLENAKAAILGLTFKKNSDDTRNSLSFKAKKIFLAEGAQVALHDPYINSESIDKILEGADVVFIAMNHDFYRDMDKDMLKSKVKKDALICDIWNMSGLNKIFYFAAELQTKKK